MKLSFHVTFHHRSRWHLEALILLPRHISMPSKRHVEATVFELAIFLTQGAGLAAKMKAAIVARPIFQHVFTPHPGTIDTGVYARTPRQYSN